jgi:flagellar biosynthesis protein
MSEFDKLMAKKAAALRYDPDKNGAPVVVASGMGYMAEKITETAMKAGVPVYEDDSLASLLTQLDLGAEIPPELYQAIVEIYVYFLGFTADKTAKDDKKQDAGTAGGTTTGGRS